MSNPFRKIFLATAAIAFSVLCQGQDIASLKKELEDATSDSLRLEITIKLSKETQNIDFQEALKYGNDALELANKMKSPWGYYVTYSQLGILSTQGGDYTSALKYDNQNLTYAIERKDSSKIAEILNFIGNDYSDLGQYDEAYYYFTQAFKIAKSIPDSMRMNITMHNVGGVFKELGQYDIAISHFEAARKIGQKANDKEGIAYFLDEMGDVYLRRGEYQKAEEMLRGALKEIRSRKLSIIENRTLSKLARLNFALKNYEDALAYYDSTIEQNSRFGHEFGLADAELGKANVYLAQAKYQDAATLAQRSLEASKSLHAIRLETQCYDLLSRLAEKTNDLKNALTYYKRFKTLEDSLYSQKTMEKLYQNQLRFETENKDTEIAQLSLNQQRQQSEIKRQEFIRNIFVVVLALAVILLFTVYRSGQRRIRINKLLLDHQEEIKKRSVELEQLNQVKDKFFSIISHDLRSPMNALSAILDMVDKNQLSQEEFSRLTKEIRIQFNHTKTLINNLLDWTLLQMDKLKIQEERINLRQMVDENFKLLSSLHLKNIKLENNISADSFAKADTNMVNLVFRNLILNGIKFTEEGGQVSVACEAKEGKWVVAVSDNGVGITPDVQKILFEKTSGYSTRGTANEKGTGLGLILCKEFVEKNGGKIWLESTPGKGTTFYFTLKK